MCCATTARVNDIGEKVCCRYGDTEIEMPVFMEGISAVGNAEKEMNQKVQEKGNTEKV